MNSPIVSSQSFINQQKQYKRVRQAYTDKEALIKKILKEKGVEGEFEIFFRAFKKEEKLEVWIKDKDKEKYVLLKTYDFCASSGSLGPKRKRGDGQIPEGLYYIDRFNPVSNFYLSLGINYPNASDRILGVKGNLGGDIFIHGDCVTIGCIPITDDKIKEVYLLAVEAKSNGQSKIPVHIFPTKLTETNLAELKKEYKDTNLYSFWLNLSDAYKYFEDHKKLPDFWVSKDGSYILK